MYERNRATGTVWITMKRTAMRRRPKRGEPQPSAEEVLQSDEYKTLIRASDGKKKVSTVVRAMQS